MIQLPKPEKRNAKEGNKNALERNSSLPKKQPHEKLDVTARDLVIFWDAWLNTVRTIERKNRVKISKRRYEATYAKILQLCADGHTAPQNPSASVQPVHVAMRYLVTPWVNLESLAQADRRILRNLLAQCQEVDGIMHPRRIPCNTLFFRRLLVLLPFILACYALVEHAWFTAFVRSSFTMVYRRSTFAFVTMSTEHWLAGFTLVVVAIGAWMTRDMRSY